MSRHPLDPLSFAAGLGFLVFGLAGLAEWLDLRDVDEDWLIPIALVLVGVMLLASVISRAGGRGVLDQPAPAPARAPAPAPAPAPASAPAPAADDARDGPGTDVPPAV
jgi:hypothetical protein